MEVEVIDNRQLGSERRDARMCQSAMQMKLKRMKERERFGTHKSNTCGKIHWFLTI